MKSTQCLFVFSGLVVSILLGSVPVSAGWDELKPRPSPYFSGGEPSPEALKEASCLKILRGLGERDAIYDYSIRPIFRFYQHQKPATYWEPKQYGYQVGNIKIVFSLEKDSYGLLLDKASFEEIEAFYESMKSRVPIDILREELIRRALYPSGAKFLLLEGMLRIASEDPKVRWPLNLLEMQTYEELRGLVAKLQKAAYSTYMMQLPNARMHPDLEILIPRLEKYGSLQVEENTGTRFR